MQPTDFLFVFPLIGVILVARWLFSDASVKSANAAKIHATSNYNR